MRKKEEEILKEILKSIPTWRLVEELSTRCGVEKKWIEPYEKIKKEYEGPVVILEVVD